MADLYATIEEVAPDLQERLGEVLELRAADHRQREMLAAYLSEIEVPPGSRVLEVGCGTGCVSRTLARWPGVAEVVGLDPSSVFLARARELGSEILNLSFKQGDGRAIPFAAQDFDLVVVHTTLSHVPEPAGLIAEAFRVLRPEGWLAVFDGDYATATVSLGPSDPLSACIEAFRGGFVHDPWLVRRLPQLLRSGGFEPRPLRSHGYLEAGEGGYLLSWVDRGAEVLRQAERIDQSQAEAFKAEARRRSGTGQWFGHIAFASLWGQKPA
jgi:ubiquinone/menaquinone biosynthesis C-methylase UbiE